MRSRMWISPGKSPQRGLFPVSRGGELTTRRGIPGPASGNGGPKVNTHTGDNPVSINRVFMRAVACVLAGFRGTLVYWMYDYID